MSIQSNFPALKPTLLLDFANTRTLDPRITFTRASTATFYDGRTVAKAEENLLTYSQEFDAWTKDRATVTANSVAAPDGTTTADTLTEDTTASNSHRVTRSVTTTATPHTISCFAKPNGRSWIYFKLFDSSASARLVFFDVTNGAIGTTGPGLTASIQSAGGGWYRCVATISAAASGPNTIIMGLSNADNVEAYTGDGTSGVYLWGAQLEQRSSVTAYTPTTAQPITNYVPVLQTAAAGVARFDHNPVTGESLGLLIEEQRTNLLQRSEEFDNAYWNKTRSSIQSNVVVAPDGTLTGDKFVENTDTNTHLLTPTVAITLSTGIAYSYTIYAKAAERSICRLGNNDLGGVFFDLSSETITSTGAGFTGSITSVGNGWYRLNAVQTSNSNANGRLVVTLVSTGTTTSYTGDGYSGIYIWGAQLEAGAFPTSYIKTEASQVTRSADAASMTGANFSSWYRQDEGTVFGDVVLRNAPSISTFSLYSVSDNSANERIFVGTGSGSGGNINAVVTDGGVLQAQTVNGSLSAAGQYKYANAYKTNDFASVANGATAVVDTAGTVPTVDRLYIGLSAVATAPLNGTIKRLTYYPLRLSNANLQALTS